MISGYMVSQAEIEELYDMKKIIEEDWIWETDGPNLIGEATVYCFDSEAILSLKAWKRRSYGFCLLYKSSKVVRRWDDSRHRNPDGEVIDGSHKHKWHPQYEDNCAYPVDDVATDDVDKAFQDFLNECNIELRGDYQRQDRLEA
ncbi:DUF6978 family protein [Halorubrum coriense]|uniref:DUF6978 family protein n=1 Tax=Halorubrum coriense TaxID=64713 RepID=UPI0012680113|nr:hypothetical protein [Halorubrum coriense]